MKLFVYVGLSAVLCGVAVEGLETKAGSFDHPSNHKSTRGVGWLFDDSDTKEDILLTEDIALQDISVVGTDEVGILLHDKGEISGGFVIGETFVDEASEERHSAADISLVGLTISSHGNAIPIAIGDDFKFLISDNDILRGFKVDHDDGENLRAKVFTGEVEAVPWKTQKTVNQIITSVDEMNDFMELSGELSVGYGPASLSGAGRYFENKVSSDNHVTLCYRTRRMSYAKQVKVDTLTSLIDDLSSDGVADKYGSKFVNSVIYGAQLDVIYTITSQSKIDASEIQAQMGGKIDNPFGLNIGFKGKFDSNKTSAEELYHLNIVVKSSGVEFPTPNNPSFDEVNEIIKEFNDKYGKIVVDNQELDNIDDNNALKQLSPVAFTISSIANYVENLNADEVRRVKDKMTNLQEVVASSYILKSKLKFALDRQGDIYADGWRRDFIYEPFANDANAVITSLEETIDSCLEFRGLLTKDKLTDDVPKMKLDPSSTFVEGLLGTANIMPPFKLVEDGREYERDDGMYFHGFAIERDGEFHPRMGGEIRLLDDDEVIAEGETLMALEDAVYAHLNPSPTAAPTVSVEPIIQVFPGSIPFELIRSGYSTYGYGGPVILLEKNDQCVTFGPINFGPRGTVKSVLYAYYAPSRYSAMTIRKGGINGEIIAFENELATVWTIINVRIIQSMQNSKGDRKVDFEGTDSITFCNSKNSHNTGSEKSITLYGVTLLQDELLPVSRGDIYY